MLNPKYYQIGPKKLLNSSKTELHTLMNDVERSRMAVDNIQTFRSLQGKMKQQIEALQNELQNWITNINIETKRHNVLNELVSLLQSQMLKYQSTKKKQQQQQQTKQNKLIAKFQYEIDQILQKHNQEIAKMHNLKEIANSRRSERVVYSNLFKKLEKQIKHYQEIYKERLLITECSIPRTCQFVRYDYKIVTHNKEYYNEEDKGSDASQLVLKNYQRRYTDSPHNTPPNEGVWNGFMTANNEDYLNKLYKALPQHKKFHLTNNENEKIQAKTSKTPQQKFQHSKELLKKISEVNNSIEKIKVFTECSTTEQIIGHYSQLEQQNKKLVIQIKDFDDRIDKITTKNIQTNKLIAQQECASELTAVPLTALKQCNQMNLDQSSITTNKQQETQKQLRQICQNLGIWMDDHVNLKQKKQFIQLMDQKLSILCNEISKNRYETNKRQDTLLSETIVDCLLQKMDKYQNCQKIFDQNLFRQQYYKELSKRRPNRSKKDAAK